MIVTVDAFVEIKALSNSRVSQKNSDFTDDFKHEVKNS